MTTSAVLSEIFDRRAEARLDAVDEAAALSRAKAGDEEATVSLLLAYAPALRSAVSRYRNSLDTEEARAVVLAAFVEVIDRVPEGDRVAGFVSPMLTKALDEAAGHSVGFAVPTRTLQRFYGILREAGGDTTAAAVLAPQRSMTLGTFLSVLQAVRSVDALDGWGLPDDERADLIDEARPMWDEDTETEDRILVEAAFAAVDDDEARACRVAYAFEDPEPQPDAVVAERLGVSRPKAQRIRARGLGKMRSALGAA